MGDIDLLPEYEDAIKLPRNEFLKFANEVFNYKSNCLSAAAQFHDKFLQWCLAMDCVSSEEQCHVAPYGALSSASVRASSAAVRASPRPSTTLSYVQLMASAGLNGSCYDDFFCVQRHMAPGLHVLLGALSLVLCLAGVLANLIFLPAFNVVSNRTGSTLYLTAMTLFDCVYMTLFSVIVVICFIPYDYIEQLEMYARFTANLIPAGLPTMELMELLSVWITVALLVDRFLYLKFGFHSKLICSRKLSMQIIGTVIFLLTVYTIPKYLEYQLVEYESYKIIRVMYTTVGGTESFQNLLLHWLKVPVEMFLPYLTVAIFSILNSIKLYDLMFKRKLSEASKEKKLKDENERSKLTSSIVCEDFDKAKRFPSLAIESKIPMITHSLKCLEDKENAIVIVSLILGFSLIAIKIPKFVLHALKSEKYVNVETTKYFHPATDFMDLIWVALKPFMFCVAEHFRVAVKSVFCCRRFDDDVIIKVLPVIEMDNIANDYIMKLQNSMELQSFEESKLLEAEVRDSCMKVNDESSLQG